MVLLGKVGQVEVGAECAGDLLRALHRPRRHEAFGQPLVAGGAAGGDDKPAEALHVAKQLLATLLRDHLAEQAAEKADVAPQRFGNLLTRADTGRGRVGPGYALQTGGRFSTNAAMPS